MLFGTYKRLEQKLVSKMAYVKHTRALPGYTMPRFGIIIVLAYFLL